MPLEVQTGPTTLGPSEVHPQTIGVFLLIITNPFILSQLQKIPNFSRMSPSKKTHIIVSFQVRVYRALLVITGRCWTYHCTEAQRKISDKVTVCIINLVEG